MPEPKKRTTRHKAKIREYPKKKKKIALIKCKKCDTLVRPHHACKVCGTYKGRTYIDVEKREKRKQQKIKEEERREKEDK